MSAASKKNAAPDKGGRKMIKCPSKTGINLNIQENRRRDRLTLVIGVVAIAALVAAVVNFGVIDQYRRLDKAQAEHDRVHSEYTQVQDALQEYDRVLLEYRTYSMDWMSDSDGEDLSTIVDRQEVLDLLEKEMFSRGRLTALQITGDKLVVAMSGMSLDQISQMFADLRLSPIVQDVALDLASTEDGNTAAILDFSVRITLRQAEEAAQ